jgi:hypothetical protein
MSLQVINKKKLTIISSTLILATILMISTQTHFWSNTARDFHLGQIYEADERTLAKIGKSREQVKREDRAKCESNRQICLSEQKRSWNERTNFFFYESFCDCNYTLAISNSDDYRLKDGLHHINKQISVILFAIFVTIAVPYTIIFIFPPALLLLKQWLYR